MRNGALAWHQTAMDTRRGYSLLLRAHTFIPLSPPHRATTEPKSRSPTPAIRSSVAGLYCLRRVRALTAWAISLSPPAPPGSCGCPRPPRLGSCHRPRLPPSLTGPRLPYLRAWLSLSQARCAVLHPHPSLASTLARGAHPSPRRPHGALPGGERCTPPISFPLTL